MKGLTIAGIILATLLLCVGWGSLVAFLVPEPAWLATVLAIVGGWFIGRAGGRVLADVLF